LACKGRAKSDIEAGGIAPGILVRLAEPMVRSQAGPD